jgi:DNA N-6-adenine-methyltransferase (Dam)
MKKNAVHDTWLTPKYFYDQLNTRFAFDDFDPCPPDNDISEFNGLQVDWAERTFCNPPYSQKLKEAFIRKALAESQLGKLAVLLVSVSTSTRIFHDLVMVYGRVEFIFGRLPFEGVDNDGNWCNPGMGMVPLPNPPLGAKQIRRSGQVDLMLIIFGG